MRDEHYSRPIFELGSHEKETAANRSLLTKYGIEETMARVRLDLPELAEVEVMRHFVNLSQKNWGVDSGFYPLGSCTMKYNPKVNDAAAGLPQFAGLHPFAPEAASQGALRIMWELQEYLAEIAGLPAVTLQPAAGAQGELTGMLIARGYHKDRGEGKRDVIVVPDSSHGTNPATAARTGCTIRSVATNERGNVSLDDLDRALGDDVAAVMLTNPNTLGLFEEEILEVSRRVHDCGALMYLDGANMNANLGIVRPAAMGFDIMHYNLHKTFSSPHGGGGPGSGPVAVADFLADFLPVPIVTKQNDTFRLKSDIPKSIGRVHTFYGNFGVLVRAYVYIRMLGPDGLRKVSESAVLAANYVQERLKDHYDVPHGERRCMHEFVASAVTQKEQGASARDVAKRLIDYGFHPPTLYFPLIVPEALMIEPTETESKATLDAFCDAMIAIADEAKNDPELVKSAPQTAPVKRLDEAAASRNLKVRWTG
jgi:glycine dehydrogenase subunit 2